MRTNNLYWSIFKLLLLLNMLMSLDVWFFWGLNRIIVSSFVTAYCVLFRVTTPQAFRSNDVKLIVSYIFIFLAYLITLPSRNIVGWVSAIIRIIPPLFIILLNKEYALDFFRFFKKVLSYFLLVSLIGWVLYLAHVPLPHSEVSFGELDGFARYSYYNYFIFLVNTGGDWRFDLIPRFHSVFTEPGFLGCIMAVLLYSEGYELKKKPQNWIFLATLVFSFSLAGWLISLVGFMLSELKPNLRSIVIIAFSVTVFFALFSFSRDYNGGNNLLYNVLFSRLEYDESTGTIQGYNRSSMAVGDYFDYFLRSDHLLFGEGTGSINVDLTKDSVDWKSFMIKNGLIATLLVFFYYMGPAIIARRNKYNYFGVALVFLFVAMQTTYGIFSCMYISLFALSVKNVDYL